MIDRSLIGKVHATLRAACSGCSCIRPIYSEDDNGFRFCRDCTVRGYDSTRGDAAPLFLDVSFV